MTDQVNECGVCRIGRRQPTKAPYMYWVEDQVLLLPNAPAFVCDICGTLDFDPAFVWRMERLLQELESNVQANETVESRSVNLAVNWQSTRGR